MGLGGRVHRAPRSITRGQNRVDGGRRGAGRGWGRRRGRGAGHSRANWGRPVRGAACRAAGPGCRMLRKSGHFRALSRRRSRSRTTSQSPSADWGLGGQSMLEGIDTRCTVERAHGASSNCPGWNVRSYTCPSSHGARSIVRISGVRVPSGCTAHGPSSKVPQTHAPRCTVHRADAACAETERAAWTLRGGGFGNLKKKKGAPT